MTNQGRRYYVFRLRNTGPIKSYSWYIRDLVTNQIVTSPTLCYPSREAAVAMAEQLEREAAR